MPWLGFSSWSGKIPFSPTFLISFNPDNWVKLRKELLLQELKDESFRHFLELFRLEELQLVSHSAAWPFHSWLQMCNFPCTFLKEVYKSSQGSWVLPQDGYLYPWVDLRCTDKLYQNKPVMDKVFLWQPCFLTSNKSVNSTTVSSTWLSTGTSLKAYLRLCKIRTHIFRKWVKFFSWWHRAFSR